VTIICDLLNLYVLILVIRAVLSWFPIRPDSGLIPVLRALDTIINPVLMPLRRIIPPAGMFDLSYIALFIIILLIESAVCSSHGLI